MRIRVIAVFASLALFASAAHSRSGSSPALVTSPDGKLTATIQLRDLEGASGVPTYSVLREGKELVGPSRLGLVLEGATFDPLALCEGLEVISTKRETHASTWRPVYGERSDVLDQYQLLTVELRSKASPQLRQTLQFRAYDDGIAFCYAIPALGGIEEVTIARDRSEFRFLEDHRAWAVYSAQGNYETTNLSKIRPGCERPLTIETAGGPYLAVGEARLVDFARMRLAPLEGAGHSLVADLSGNAVCRLPFRSPWRYVMVADSPGKLLENSDFILNLNDPCEIEDTSWIRPGKVLREVTLTTEGGRACVDFAAANRIEYVEFDAGWYGHEYEDDADATTVTVDPKRSKGPLDLPQVIRYAEERGVGIILYVNRRALEKQLDQVLPLFQEWGVKGVKYGFVDVGSQHWTSWLHAAVRKAAEHRLMVDVHDEYRPTGYSRTYPNLMTQEGISGDETSPTNQQTLTVLFTRMLCGAADNTICYFDGRVAKNASHAYQLAKAVCLYSPWQFLFWYDRPAGSPGAKGGAGGEKNVIGDEPELEFFTHLPTVWDDSLVIDGEIGEYATIARRKGVDWYLGCMNGAQPRLFRVPLRFLAEGMRYTASIYLDDPAVETRTHVRIDRIDVDSGTALEFELPARGGRAIRLVPRHEIFVSPEGDDANDGTLEAPLMSLEAARYAARERGADGDVNINLLSGRYARGSTFELDERDSATTGHTTTYRAMSGAEVILDGGLVVPGARCSNVSDPAIVRRLLPEARGRVAELDLGALGVLNFGDFGPRGFARPTLPAPVELFVDGTPLEIARWPNRGEPLIPLGEVLDKGSVPRFGDDGNRGGVFRYDTERALRWTEAWDLHISGIFCWGYADDTVAIERIDTEQGTFKTVQPHRYGFGNSHQKSLWNWYAGNLLEEIDQPGEYYVDRESGIAYLMPPDIGRPIGEATIQISLSFVNNLVIDCPVMIKNQCWNQERWDEFLAGEQQQQQLLRQVDVRSEPYASRYPRLARIFETLYSREQQHEARNYVTTAADPLLTDGAAMDFTIRDLEKLRELVPGFEPIPFEKIGLYRDEYRNGE